MSLFSSQDATTSAIPIPIMQPVGNTSDTPASLSPRKRKRDSSDFQEENKRPPPALRRTNSVADSNSSSGPRITASTSNERTSLGNLPAELVDSICQHLDEDSLLQLRLASRDMYRKSLYQTSHKAFREVRVVFGEASRAGLNGFIDMVTHHPHLTQYTEKVVIATSDAFFVGDMDLDPPSEARNNRPLASHEGDWLKHFNYPKLHWTERGVDIAMLLVTLAKLPNVHTVKVSDKPGFKPGVSGMRRDVVDFVNASWCKQCQTADMSKCHHLAIFEEALRLVIDCTRTSFDADDDGAQIYQSLLEDFKIPDKASIYGSWQPYNLNYPSLRNILFNIGHLHPGSSAKPGRHSLFSRLVEAAPNLQNVQISGRKKHLWRDLHQSQLRLNYEWLNFDTTSMFCQLETLDLRTVVLDTQQLSNLLTSQQATLTRVRLQGVDLGSEGDWEKIIKDLQAMPKLERLFLRGLECDNTFAWFDDFEEIARNPGFEAYNSQIAIETNQSTPWSMWGYWMYPRSSSERPGQQPYGRQLTNFVGWLFKGRLEIETGLKYLSEHIQMITPVST
ncbi:hypothetical protein BU16DRAFT_532534 [Lophium mytilinum]|uniref:F-box domain-containing protein n=1 Tax=Lophium mytilinum TaxID=390894 RepID=A0A6A6RBG5_9PEZI|nr:hypothetical protein BU16DRAFT_532534 [Lophium mytilinum]